MRLRRPAFSAMLFAVTLAACLAWPSAVPAQEADDVPEGETTSGQHRIGRSHPDAMALIEAAVRLAKDGQSVAALRQAEEAYLAVWARLPLAFRRTELVGERPAAYGQVEPRGMNAYDVGERISIYVDPIGYGWREVDGAWETDLTADFILATPEGRIIAGQKGFGNFRIRSARRNPDSFLMIDYRFSGVPPGDYLLTTTMHDRIDEESASFETSITIN